MGTSYTLYICGNVSSVKDFCGSKAVEVCFEMLEIKFTIINQVNTNQCLLGIQGDVIIMIGLSVGDASVALGTKVQFDCCTH